MQRTLLVLAMLSLTFGSVSCDSVRDLDGLRDTAATVTDRARFCLAVTRTLQGVAANSPDTAAEAAEEVLTTAPERVAGDARELVEAVRETVEDGSGLDRPALVEAADQLRDATQQLCDTR